ncbi:MAG: AAA family ATPase [Actinobacteria bacterium]|nr:AAA family ATPase [Actinomycetota bacterium]
MSDNKRFMNEVFRIVNGALRLDTEKVRSYTAFLADKLESEGDSSSARRLRRMLDNTDHMLRPVDVSFAQSLPVDSDSRFALVERVALRSDEPQLVLTSDQWRVVHEFLSIAKSHALLDAEGIHGSINLLMYGPPGTGKSRLARFIAGELGLELYVARLDGLISSLLGSTSKNIRALFDFAARTPCVLFLDEFDAIAKLRGDTQELGELKRVVNSFIQNLDSLGSQSIVLAATNHQDLLDSAVWRRFGYRLELTFPDANQRKALWVGFLGSLSFSTRDLDVLVDLSDGLTGSDIEEVCRRLKRLGVVTDSESNLGDAFLVLLNIGIGEEGSRRFVSRLRGENPEGLIRILRERDERLYSLAVLAALLGVSKSTVHRLVKEDQPAEGVEPHGV